MAPIVADTKGTPDVKNAEIDNNGLIFQNFGFIILLQAVANKTVAQGTKTGSCVVFGKCGPGHWLSLKQFHLYEK